MFRRNDESGLTTLEWLLIVAAVAGLAALAVVLVQNVVDRTAEQIGGSSARQTAAAVAAQQIIDNADRDADEQPASARTYEDWAVYYNARCTRLAITYGDSGISVDAVFDYGTSVDGTHAVARTVINTADATADSEPSYAGDKARAYCGIS